MESRTTSYISLLRNPRCNKFADKIYVTGICTRNPRKFCKWKPLTFWNTFKGLSMKSRNIQTQNCAPVQYTVWPRNVVLHFFHIKIIFSQIEGLKAKFLKRHRGICFKKLKNSAPADSNVFLHKIQWVCFWWYVSRNWAKKTSTFQNWEKHIQVFLNQSKSSLLAVKFLITYFQNLTLIVSIFISPTILSAKEALLCAYYTEGNWVAK